MDTITGYNGKLVCTAFPKKQAEVRLNKGVVTVQQKTVLTQLTVVYGNGKDLFPGDVVYVRGDNARSWGTADEFEMDEQRVVLVSPEYVLLVKRVGSNTATVVRSSSCDEGFFQT